MMILTKPRKELFFWGGVLEFEDLEPGTYTAEAEAWNTAENLLEGSGSAEIKVKAGETTDCTIKMILEGIFYSKYMLFRDYCGWNAYAYDYSTCTKKKIWSTDSNSPQYFCFAESNDGSIYYMKLDLNSSGYRIYNYNFTTSTEKTEFTIDAQYFFDGYYDSTTNSYWVINKVYNTGADNNNLCLYKDKNGHDTGIIKNSFENCAIRGENLYYSFDGDSIGYAKFDYTSGNPAEVKAEKTLSDFGVDSGEINDIAVLEDGRVAIIVRDTNTSSTNDNTTKTVIYNYTVTDGGTVTSRGALLILSSDLSDYKVLGWSGERTISATGSSSGYGTTWNSITANIPEYSERNSHFYGPMRIVAVRPKELVIADCGANFVLPDYSEKKNGKMFTHNRLMTVNLRNFAISCKKEFTEDEIKFWNLAISGNLTVTSSGTDGWSDGVEK